MTMSDTLPPPELSRRVRLDPALYRNGRRMEIAAEGQECAALAQRFSLQEITSLQAHVTLSPLREARYLTVEGQVRARVVETCSVTLAPLPVALDEPFAVVFDLKAPETATVDMALTGPELADTPEPLTGDNLDVGELVAEHLALALDPWPRSPEAVVEWGDPQGPSPEQEAQAQAAAHPFAALARLKTDPDPDAGGSA